MDRIQLEQQNISILGQGSKILGELHLSGVVQIDSYIEGKIFVDESAQISIETNGYVKGEIFCNDIQIFGEFHGKLQSTGRVILQPSCIVCGTIESENLTVYPGAMANLEGQTL